MHRLRVVVTRTGTSQEARSPETALRLLESSAYVVVENSTSDGAFLRAMMRALEREELKQALENQWWDIEHAGGKGEIEKRVEELIRHKRIPANRILILADSDRLFSCQSNDTSRTLAAAGKKHGVCVLLLHKREIENYLPVSSLQKARQVDTYRAFLELTQEQRDHYDMKGGFKEDHRGDAIIPSAQQEIFGKVRKHVLRDLCGGFGPVVWQLFEQPGIDAHAVAQTCTTCPHEIEGILDLIEGLL